MENKNIIEIIGALRGEIKDIVKEAMTEVLAGRTVNIGVDLAKEEDKTGATPAKVEDKVVKPLAKVEPVEEEVVETEEELVETDRKAELDAMSYKEVQAVIKDLGGKAVGSKAVIIERILELEAETSVDEAPAEEVEEEVEVPEVIEEIVETEPEVEEESVEEDSEEEGDSEDEEAFREFLVDLDKDALLEIGEMLEVKVPKKWNKGAYVEMLIIDIDALYQALEELGYYDEEDGDKEDLVDEVDEVEEEPTLADELSGKTLEELATLCADNGLSTKGKKQALIDRIVKAVEAGEMSLDDEDEVEAPEEVVDEVSEDDEWYTLEELEAMSLDDLREIAEMNELEIPTKKVKGKKVVDKDALIAEILALGEEEESDEEVIEEDSSDDSEGEFEVSEARMGKEAEIESDIRVKYRGKKLKDSAIKKFLEKYNEGDPRYSAPTKEEALDEYVNIHISLVDDEGEVHGMEDCYIRDASYYCCGRELSSLDNGDLYCSVCGVEYQS